MDDSSARLQPAADIGCLSVSEAIWDSHPTEPQPTVHEDLRVHLQNCAAASVRRQLLPGCEPAGTGTGLEGTAATTELRAGREVLVFTWKHLSGRCQNQKLKSSKEAFPKVQVGA
ncbi:hypothetical protein QTO34_001663 [Cnephaeus nilssonii]|uniref:Uncharacterized protein n=1 Tax=Cnephaeus nilssonii TaxID=3371016 RepID=A0AA40HW39_CNENI|nr:hypothetical protein QTO34_001663 [Eptesicus nilssonii]